MAQKTNSKEIGNSLKEIYVQRISVEGQKGKVELIKTKVKLTVVMFIENDRTKKRGTRTVTHINPNIKGAPVDYSFRKVYALSDLVDGTPRQYRVGIPKKASTGKFISSSLWANYNHLTDLKNVYSLVNFCLNRPEMIGWLDVSFNDIEFISDEILKLNNLKILYLHGNKIKFFIEVFKLKALGKLRTLTLHGNPIQEQNNYRSIVLKTLTQLKNFDFSVVLRN